MRHGYCDDGLDLKSLLEVRNTKPTSRAVKAHYSAYIQRQRQRAIWEHQTEETACLVAEYMDDKIVKEVKASWKV